MFQDYTATFKKHSLMNNSAKLLMVLQIKLLPEEIGFSAVSRKKQIQGHSCRGSLASVAKLIRLKSDCTLSGRKLAGYKGAEA